MLFSLAESLIEVVTVRPFNTSPAASSVAFAMHRDNIIRLGPTRCESRNSSLMQLRRSPLYYCQSQWKDARVSETFFQFEATRRGGPNLNPGEECGQVATYEAAH